MKLPGSATPSGRRAIRAALALAAAGLMTGAPMAYTIVTRDGHRIEAQARPEIKGLQALLRLAPNGRLAVIQEERIDWARTEAINGGTPAIAVPSGTVVTEGSEAAPGSAPIDLKIYGKPGERNPEEAPSAGAATPKTPAGPPGSPADQKRINAEEALIKLAREYGQVKAAREQEAERRKGMEDELASLRSRETGYASESSTAQQRIRDLETQLAEAIARISKLESRLADIRAQAVELGGTID